LKKFEGIFGILIFFTFYDLVKISLNLDKNVMIMNQNCHDEPNKKSHTNTPDHHRPKRNACNKSTVYDRNTKTRIFVQLPLFSSNFNVQHKNITTMFNHVSSRLATQSTGSH
jgi:hypothetical protein